MALAWMAGLLHVAAAAPSLPVPAPTAPSAPLPTNPLITAWPASQPVAAAASCTSPAPAAGTVMLVQSRLETGTSDPTIVDPTAPCHQYVENRRGSITRSDDMGTLFRTILQVPPNVNLSPIAARGSGSIELFDFSGTNAILHSDDYGAHWRQQGTDLPITGGNGTCTTCLQAVAYSPSAPNVGYAAISGNQILGSSSSTILRTTDGGTTWSIRGTPGVPLVGGRPQHPVLVVDPANPDHLFGVGEVGSDITPNSYIAAELVESRDAGETWAAINLPRSDPPDNLVINAGGLYVAYDEADIPYPSGSAVPQLLVYRNQTFSSLSLPLANVAAWFFGFAPNRPAAGLFVGLTEDPSLGPALVLADSRDGFQSLDNTRTVLLPNPQQAFGCVPTSGQETCRVLVMPDTMGNFWIDARAGASNPHVAIQVYPDALLAVRPPLTSLPALSVAASTPPASSGPGSTAGNGGSSGGGGPPPLSLVPASLKKTCQLPNSVNGASSGSLAYDGQSLLYTDAADDATQANTAVIRKFDPTSCLATGVILVTFNPAEVLAVDPDPTYRVEIGGMSYDARRQVLWASLRSPQEGNPNGLNDGDSVGAPIRGLFTVKVTDPSPSPVEHASATLALSNGCGYVLAYDFTSDGILSCNPPQSNDPSQSYGPVIRKMRASDGSLIPSCLDAGQLDFATTNYVGWTVTRPGQVYAESEDDKTMYAVSIPETAGLACSFGTAYAHPVDGEPLAEDEQLACDSQTFSTNGVTRTVVWIRNTGHTAFSYDVPGGRCPLPTFTNYVSPRTLPLQAAASFCASTTVHYLEGYKPLPPGSVISFSSGSQQLGTASSDGGPIACTSPATEPLAVGAHPITATFAGTDAFLPSIGTGVLQVVAAPPPGGADNLAVAPVAGPVGGPPPPADLVQTATAPQAQAAQQAQIQAQSEAQTQAQSQAQAQSVVQMQPGVMVQRQKRTQIATQEQGVDTNVAYEASLLRRTRAAPAVAVAAGLMLLGFGLVARRPRWALSGRHRRE